MNRAILEASQDGIYGLDRDGITMFANLASARMTGWLAAELVGKRQHAAFPWTCETCHRDDGLFWRKDGTSFPVEYSVTPLWDKGDRLGDAVIFRDITERKKRELHEQDRHGLLENLVTERTGELRKANTKLNAILKAADSVALMAADHRGVLTLFNSGAESLLGYTADEVVDKHSFFLFHLPEDIKALQSLIEKEADRPVRARDSAVEIAIRDLYQSKEWTLVRKDGAPIRVCLNVTPLLDAEGGVTGHLGIAFDISSREAEQQALQQAKTAAEDANRIKSEFLATMSHEIRTPMNGILGMAELLLQSELTSRQRKRTEVLRDSGEALLGILNDILDFSKIEANKLALEFNDFDLREVVEGVVDLMAVKAQQSGLELICIIEPSVPTRLRGDSSRLRQVIVNLVGNALKFTPRGEVVVRVSYGTQENSSLFLFKVKDSGIGIPFEKQHLLYQRFSQADASTARRYGGTGLGLSIIRGLVEMMEGQTGFVSEPGRGSTFWFTAALKQQSAALRPKSLSMAGKRILVVDDNQASREVIVELLTFWKCEAEQADSAAAALALLRDKQEAAFDAILIDLEMPSWRGDRLGTSIHEDPRFQEIPLILLVPLNCPRHSKYSAFTAQITKPLKQGTLGACLATLVGYGPAPFVPGRNPERVPLAEREERGRHRLLVVEDNPVNQEVAIGLLDWLGYRADLAADALSALDLLRHTSYTLALMDCQLPGMDGYELCRRIRDPANGAMNTRIPIIAMTAHALSGDREKCLEAGMDDFLMKPVNAAVLERVLKQWTSGVSPEAPAIDDRQEPERAAMEFDGIDLVERMMGNTELARRVVGSFIEDTPLQLAALAQALGNGDAAALQLAAHSLKGAAANVGNARLREMAFQIESMGEAGDFQSAAAALPALTTTFDSLKPLLQSFCQDSH